MKYFTYIVRCADDTLYTGWSTNVVQRVKTHNSGRGAKYTRMRLPVQLVWYENFYSRHDAMHWEQTIKQWPREKKEQLLKDHMCIVDFLEKNKKDR